MDQRQAFGKVLRRLRKKRHLSQEELAFEAEVDRTYVSLLELGRNAPSLEIMFKLAGALGYKCSTLILEVEHLLESPHD